MGGQQPQQLLVFLDFFERLDGVITFDGHNEIIIPPFANKGNIPSHFPYYPYYIGLYGPSISNKEIFWFHLANYLQNLFEKCPEVLKYLLQKPKEYLKNNIFKMLNQLNGQEIEFHALVGQDNNKDKEQLIQNGAKNWYRNLTIMFDLCRLYQIEQLFILQPTPEIGKILTDVAEIRIKGYEYLKTYMNKMVERGAFFKDFTYILKDI